MKPEDILCKHVDKESMDELSENVWPDIIDAMKEYALHITCGAVGIIKQIIDEDQTITPFHAGYDENGNYVYKNKIIVSDTLLNRMYDIVKPKDK